MDKTKSKDVLLKDYNDMSTDTVIDFELTFTKDVNTIVSKETGNIDGIEKLLKLYSNLSTTNMHMFNEKEKLVKYDIVISIIDAYYKVRLEYYDKRKKYMISRLKQELVLLKNKAEYIKENLSGSIDLRNKKKDEIIKMLKDKKYAIIDSDNDYKYLLKMTMDSVSKENVDKILKDFENKQNELDYVEKTSIEKMWFNELEELEKLI